MKFSEFIPPFSDFGFKNLYGKPKPESKENLRFLLNAIIKDWPGLEHDPIVDLQYRNPDHQGDNPERKSTKFDVYCVTESGKHFIVEMQNQPDRHLKQRLIFYLCQAVTELDRRTNSQEPWNYDFPPVLVIMMCNFIDPEIDHAEVNYFGLVNLKTHRPLGGYIGLSFIQIPLFPEKREDCKTEIERIVFSMDNMEAIINNKVESFSTREGDFYDRIKTMSQTAALSEKELHAYHQWLKVENDERLRLKEARDEGMARGEKKGRAEGRAEGERQQAWRSAERMFAKEMPLEEISEFTGLTVEELKERFN